MTDAFPQPRRLQTLQSRAELLASSKQQRQLLRRLPLVDFAERCQDAGTSELRRTEIAVLQVNVGKLCNQVCRHCHVDAGPDRREIMTRETLEQCLAALVTWEIPTVDITGGAPELNPSFVWFVKQCRAEGIHVMHRCNLTVLATPRFRHFPQLLADHSVEIVASLPHYRALHTDRQRGKGVFEKSLDALRALNDVGYGTGQHRLTLVTNPAGAFLPGTQTSMEQEWKNELARRHGIFFDSLYAITNMPISRYLEWLIGTGNLELYMERLVSAFNPATLKGLMCRNTINVGWNGELYDCDFNQMLEMPIPAGHIADFDPAALHRQPIATGQHCFGCTAGDGSSCGGATV